MKLSRILMIGVAAVIIGLTGCASTELAYYDFDEQRVAVDARVAPDAQVDASYSVEINADDPVRTALSIGSSLAKAGQVSRAEDKLASAMRATDIRAIVEDELGRFVDTTLGSRIVDSRRDADLQLLIDIEEYGIDAGGSGVDFELTAVASLWDTYSNDRIWRTRESVSEPASPDAFGLPGSVGNVFTAVALAELSEEEITRGLERLARDAAWEIGLELEDDIYRARRRR